jgi:uridine phosphorylase
MPFPHLKNKHAYESFVTPQAKLEYRKRRGKYLKIKIPENVIICYSERFLNYYKKSHKMKVIKEIYGEFSLLNETNNKVALWGDFGIGAPVTVSVMEELIALGVKRFISIGEAGSLQKNIKIGDIVICDRAIRDEGTSHHYLKYSKYAYPSKDLTEKIKLAFQKYKIKYFTGTSWTQDAPYRETVKEVKQYQKEGVATVEMEASAIFAVGKYRKVDVSAIFTISDSLAGPKWEPKFYVSRKNYETLLKVAIQSFT